MKTTFHLVWQQIKLYARIRGYLFFIFLMPMILFFLYMSIFAAGQADRVIAFLGPILAMTATSQGLYGVGGDLARSRQFRMLIPYQLASVSRSSIIASQLLVGTIVVLGVGIIQIALAVFAYGVHLHVSALVLLAVLCLGSLALGGVGVVFLSIVNSTQQSDMLLQLSFLVFVIISGMTVPLAMLPGYVQAVSQFLPTTMLVTIFQGLIIHGSPAAAYWRQLIILVLFFLTSAGIAINLFRWDNEQKASRRRRLFAALCILPLVIGGAWLHIR